MSPIQIAILPVSEKVNDYAYDLKTKFDNVGFRSYVDEKPDKIGSKIRAAELKKIPIMLIVGEKEAANESVSLRRRFVGDQSVGANKIIDEIIDEINKETTLSENE